MPSNKIGLSLSGDIHINEEIYDEYVGRIKSNNEDTISDDSGYEEPDSQCLLNPVIPTYQDADHIAMDMMLAMKSETRALVKLMEKVKNNYIEVNDVKEKEI